MSVELKKRGIGEWFLWHLFGLVPYWIRTKKKEVIFYASVKNCQAFDKFITTIWKEKDNVNIFIEREKNAHRKRKKCPKQLIFNQILIIKYF